MFARRSFGAFLYTDGYDGCHGCAVGVKGNICLRSILLDLELDLEINSGSVDRRFKSAYSRCVHGCSSVQRVWCTVNTSLSCVRQGGSHASLHWSYMTRLLTFITQAEAKGRWICKRDPARSSSLWKGSAPPRGVPSSGSPIVRLVGRFFLASQMSQLFLCLQQLLLRRRLTRCSMPASRLYCH